jgi:membrane-bound lytic murein transglycosylase D
MEPSRDTRTEWGYNVKNLLLSLTAAILVAVPAASSSQTQGEAPEVPPAPRPQASPHLSTFRIPKELSFCDERVPLERDDVLERLEGEFYYLLDKQGLLVLYVKRLARASSIVDVILELEKLPKDLRFVPLAESGLVPRAISSARAVGYWQFVEPTAERYGLRVDAYVDERRDLTRSTMAAAAYLRDLHEMFGSWTAALAGYNWGEKNVEGAMEEQGTRSYYDLYLPEETERYVFRIMALKIIMEDPETYWIDVPEAELYQLPKVVDVEITSKAPLTVAILADCANVGARTIRVLNPWMRRNFLPPGEYVISVPTEASDGFRERVDRRLDARKKIMHRVKRGENLSTIASRYDVTVEAIERWNGISRRQPIHFGQKLIIWGDK